MARPALSSTRAVALRRWSVAVGIYLLAVFHRNSLGVAGLQAQSRFHIGSAELSIFVLLQLGVYAGMQIPTGLLVDRYGPRRLLCGAAALMGLAQLLFAVASDYPLALLARGLLGCGDALTFVSVLRLAAGQFAPKRFPLVVAITATVGTAGNVVATVPLTWMLRNAGWTPTFASAAVITLLAGPLVYRVLPAPLPSNGADSAAPGQPIVAPISVRVRGAWATPGTRVGFWVHFTTMSTALMIAVLWGVPFMVQGQGMSRTEAGTVLLASVLFGLAANPMIGYVVSRRPVLRVPLAIVIVAGTLIGWGLVLLLYSGVIDRTVLILLVVLTGIGGPASGIGFSMARDYNPPAIVGTATGVVNVGGFVAGTAACLAVGWSLDLAGDTGPSAFRLAFGVALMVQLAGLTQLLRWWRIARRSVLLASESGAAVPVPIVRRRWDLS